MINEFHQRYNAYSFFFILSKSDIDLAHTSNNTDIEKWIHIVITIAPNESSDI